MEGGFSAPFLFSGKYSWFFNETLTEALYLLGFEA